MIELINVTKIYGEKDNATTALNNINLKLETNKFNVIVGKSGCGKSTLMNLIGAIDKPTSGNIIIDNTDITNLDEKELSKYRNKHIGFIFQSFYLEPSFTVLQNVSIPLIVCGIDKKEREAKAHRYLSLLGIDDKANKKVTELSGGQMQRVAIARALIGEPEIILADEPTGNLDSENGKEVISLLREIVNNGKTVILVTHNNEDAKNGDVIVHLKDGEVESIENNR